MTFGSEMRGDASGHQFIGSEKKQTERLLDYDTQLKRTSQRSIIIGLEMALGYRYWAEFTNERGGIIRGSDTSAPWFVALKQYDDHGSAENVTSIYAELAEQEQQAILVGPCAFTCGNARYSHVYQFFKMGVGRKALDGVRIRI